MKTTLALAFASFALATTDSVEAQTSRRGSFASRGRGVRTGYGMARASAGQVFYIGKGKTVYMGTWKLVRSSRSSVGYVIVVNTKYGFEYRLMPSQRSVAGNVNLSYISYKEGTAFGAGQCFLRTNPQSGYYSAALRSTHYRRRNGQWARQVTSWHKFAFTFDR